jgi:VWFA-related protein
MRLPLTIVVGVVAIGATSLLARHGIVEPQADQNRLPTFHASADYVTVDVSVRRQNRPVIGLRAADFEIVDNGVPQQIAELSYSKLPIDVTVALDVSESVTGEALNQLRRAVQQLAKDLRSEDRLKLLAFNMRVTRLIDFGQGTNVMSSAFDTIKASGSTSIFDTVAVALTAASQPERRQLVLVFSDGHDNSSITDFNTLLEVVRHTTPTLGFILVSAQPSSPQAAARRQIYDRLARETGGTIVPILPPGLSLGYGAVGAAPREVNLTATFQRLLEEFGSSYVLLFTPTNVDRTGVHTLDVRVKRADVDVRARRSYAWR